jgi:RNA-binding protein
MITTKQKLYLRKLGQTLPTKFQIGKEANHPDWIHMVDLALDKQELIKLHILKAAQEDTDKLLATITLKLHAELVQVIGHRAILYRRNPSKPRIILPT